MNKENEIIELKEAHELELKTAKEDYKGQFNTLKEKFLEEREELNQRIDTITNESSRFKLKIIDHANCTEIIKKKDRSLEVRAYDKFEFMNKLNKELPRREETIKRSFRYCK